MNKRNYAVLSIFIPLFIGAFFYVFMAPETYVSKFIQNVIDKDFLKPSFYSSWIFRILRNHLCDILWAWSLSTALFSITELFSLSFAMAVFFESFMEILQKLGFVPGTFDILDIIFEMLTSFIAVYVMYRKYYVKEKNK